MGSFSIVRIDDKIMISIRLSKLSGICQCDLAGERGEPVFTRALRLSSGLEAVWMTEAVR